MRCGSHSRSHAAVNKEDVRFVLQHILSAGWGEKQDPGRETGAEST